MTTAVLIHGFSGSPESWGRVASRLCARSYVPAVCGHGGCSSAVAVVHSFEAEVDRLASEVRAAVPAPRYVAGYSLGGRLALGLLARHPDLFVGAAAIGANPGLDGEEERKARRAADETWARRIEERGLAVFDRQWSNLPLFQSQQDLDATTIEEQRRIRLSHDPGALAAAMRALSLGAMPDYRSFLPTISCPVELIVGALDAKFIGLARQMVEQLPVAKLRVVDGVGHNVPLEAPAELARLLNDAVQRTGRHQARCSVAGRRRRAG